MILRCYNCEERVIDLSKNIAVLEVESQRIFVNILSDLHDADFPAREVAVEQDGKLLRSSEILCISDLMGFELAARPVLNRLYKCLDERLRADVEARLYIDNLIAALKSGTEDVLRDFCVDFSTKDEIAFKDLFDFLGLTVYCASDTVCEKLVQFVALCAELHLCKLLVLVHPKAYMTDAEIERIYERALGGRIGLLVLESTIRQGILRNEKKICIGRDYSDIIL